MFGGKEMIKEDIQKCRKLYYPRRIRALYDCINMYPLTMIEAPMGYGKTTLTRDWVSRSGYRNIWKKFMIDQLKTNGKNLFVPLAKLLGRVVKS